MFFKIFNDREDLRQLVEDFYLEDDLSKIFEAGIQCTLALYKDNTFQIDGPLTSAEKFNQLRFIQFTSKTAKRVKEVNKLISNAHARKSKKGKSQTIDIAMLPPTADALEQHLKRVYFQIRDWLRVDERLPKLNPENWRWKKIGNLYVPVRMTKPFAPDEVLKVIFCACKKGCQLNCSCRKSGLQCTSACINCYGIRCTNILQEEIEENEDDNEHFHNSGSENESECENF